MREVSLANKSSKIMSGDFIGFLISRRTMTRFTICLSLVTMILVEKDGIESHQKKLNDLNGPFMHRSKTKKYSNSLLLTELISCQVIFGSHAPPSPFRRIRWTSVVIFWVQTDLKIYFFKIHNATLWYFFLKISNHQEPVNFRKVCYFTQSSIARIDSIILKYFPQP